MSSSISLLIHYASGASLNGVAVTDDKHANRNRRVSSANLVANRNVASTVEGV